MSTSNEIRNLNYLNCSEVFEQNNSINSIKEIPKFIMLIGLPASGKSTLAEDLSKRYNANIHASDEIRKELNTENYSKEKNQEVFSILHSRIKEDLRNYKSVIYDATNVNYKKRMAFLRELKSIPCKKVCYFKATPYETCLKRNSEREEKVPKYVIYNMYKNFDIPAYFEGWDTIHIIWDMKDMNKDFKNFQNLWEEMCKFDQHNSHHVLTLGEHCEKASKYFLDTRLYYAALFHDCGKIETASFVNSKGEVTEECHYYNHQYVSAYKALFYIRKYFSNEDILYVCQLIRWHMQPYFNDKNNKEKLDNKYKKLFGEDFWNDLMKLHEADVAAH